MFVVCRSDSNLDQRKIDCCFSSESMGASDGGGVSEGICWRFFAAISAAHVEDDLCPSVSIEST